MSLSERLARHAIGTANELEDDLLEAAATIDTQAAEIARLRSIEADWTAMRDERDMARDNYANLLADTNGEIAGLRTSLAQYETCMCGSPMDGHEGAGHSPVSQVDHRIAALEASLDEAVGVLRPFGSWAEDNTEVAGDVTEGACPVWGGNRCERERIVDWFGPSDFRAARDFVTEHGGGS